MLRFWGLSPEIAKSGRAVRPVGQAPRATRHSSMGRPRPANRANNVTRTIEDALRAAGLLR
jgi:hypothetical protein